MLSKKGFWWGRPATLIQNQEHIRNLDSKIHLLGFVCFNFQFHSSDAVTFSTASARSGLSCAAPKWGLFDHLVGSGKKRRRNCEPERPQAPLPALALAGLNTT